MKKTLSPEDIQTLLAQHSAWSLDQGMLTRTCTFPGFPQAVAFVNQAAAFAEQANHHPDIDIRYNRVRLALISHDIAALSPRDAAMVRQIDQFLAKETKS